MLNHDLVSLVENKISISSLKPEEVRRYFPGIKSVKPITFFGEPFPTLVERFKLNSTTAISSWFDRVFHAYHYYWHEPMGRMHYFEDDTKPIKGDRAAGIVDSIAFSRGVSQSSNDLIQLSFEISPVEVFRRVINMPQVIGNLEFSNCLPDNCLAHFYLIDHSMIPYTFFNSLDIHKRSTSAGVWLSRFETQLLNVSYQHCNLIAFTRGGESMAVLSKRFVLSSWEELSQSISIAHLARLTGVINYWNSKPSLNGLIVCGAIRAILAERFQSLFDCLPPDCQFEFGVTSLTINVDSAYLDSVLKAAYESKVMPTRAVPGALMSWPREKNMFDAMFEMNLHGKAAELHKWDEKAMIKGGIYAQ